MSNIGPLELLVIVIVLGLVVGVAVVANIARSQQEPGRQEPGQDHLPEDPQPEDPQPEDPQPPESPPGAPQDPQS